MTETDSLKTLIIAEAGVNHNGDINLARELIDVAAEAGADFVKFQTFTADAISSIHAKKAEYQNDTTDADESQHAMITRLELTRDMHGVLIAHCKSRGIQFFSTGFDTESIDLLVELGLGSRSRHSNDSFRAGVSNSRPGGQIRPATSFYVARNSLQII